MRNFPCNFYFQFFFKKPFPVVINDEVIVTHIQNPSVFYIQRLADSAKLQLMSKVINLIARESKVLTTNPVVGKNTLVYI